MSSTEFKTALESLATAATAAGQAIREALKKISEESKPLIKNWNDFYYGLAAALAAGQAIREALKKISEESKPLIKNWNDFYYGLAAALGDREVKKRLRQQSIRDKRQQLERSRRRQQLLAENKDKSNN